MTNGSDGPLASLWATGAAEALDRGWNAFVYDGPGQQSMLFERNVPLRPDWEAVLTPVVDALVARQDVDPHAHRGRGRSAADKGASVRILVLGAGVIGSVYAARLLQAGYEVVMLARGARPADWRVDGLVSTGPAGRRVR